MTKTKPTFSIYLANGHKKPGLVKSFLDTYTIAHDDLELMVDDGSIFDLYIEPVTKDFLWRNGEQLCIISFQVYENGDAIAVARLYRKEKNHG
jgi:hypothetical protein